MRLQIRNSEKQNRKETRKDGDDHVKLTRHNGRAGKFGTYNPKHNDRQFHVEKSDHINPERTKFNIYFDCYTGFRGNGFPEREPEDIISFEDIERMYYREHYSDFVEGQNRRNESHGHANRNRTTEDLLANKTTCPEETVYQIGTMDEHVSEDVLFRIVTEFLSEFARRFGSHVHILDFALHCDEGTPHIQERHVFDAVNQYGELCPQQEKALEELGFELPDPDKPKSKYNRRKNVFDAACREMLFDIAERHGLHLEREPSYGGRAYLEKQDYILMKQREKLAAQEKQIDEKESKLEELSIRIEDVETLIDEVAETAYDNAVEAVTERVQEETRNADFELIQDYEKEIMRSDSLTEKGMAFAHQILSDLKKKFRGMTAAITEKLKKILKDPAVKAERLKPIREQTKGSVLDKLHRADAELKARRTEQAEVKKKNRDMEL